MRDSLPELLPMLYEQVRSGGDLGEIWGGMGRYGEIKVPLLYEQVRYRGDMGRYGELWGAMGRYRCQCSSSKSTYDLARTLTLTCVP